ncbi:cytochrome b subunit of succinate dehydrogenase, Sdh3p [Elasticomyces elasticus]|nr:cytochrome b subunit of succinate dehydrogenase, Sdh3p [Elasticomyces elasticus]
MRRLAAQRPAQQTLSRFAAPAAVATNTHYLQYRQAATQTISSEDQSKANEILNRQRLNRPVSPHLSIYRPQITWYGSALNRITASILSGGFYVFGVAYLVAPLLGWHLETAVMAASVAAWPLALKVLVKMSLAFPFTYHSLNGVRHLAWDMGKTLNNKQVQRTGWAVVGLSVVSSAILAFV